MSLVEALAKDYAGKFQIKAVIESQDDFNYILKLISKYNIINHCYKKAAYFINLSSNSLSVFNESEEKKILKSLTTFSLQRSF